MLDTVEYVGYHATDESNIESIMNRGFIYQKSKKHWLGNGSYFFEDKQLAFYWASKCPKGYGMIYNPAFIQVHIKTSAQKCADLRKISHYNAARAFCIIYLKKAFEAINAINEILSDEEEIAKFRCSFFDSFKKAFDLDMLIGGFEKYKAFYINKNKNARSSFEKFRIPYIEVQYCVYNTNIIVDKKVIDGGGKEGNYEFRF